MMADTAVTSIRRMLGRRSSLPSHKKITNADYPGSGILERMRIRVLLFGQLKDMLGRAEDCVDLDSGATLSHLVEHYAKQFPQFRAFAASIALSVNQEYAHASTALKEGDEVGLLPPVSGGKSPIGESVGENAKLRSKHCAIVRQTINIEQVRQEIAHAEDGAAVVFDGVVRNNTRGRRTLYLDYEAYEAMALNEMEKLAQAALERFKIRDVRAVHRLGRLQIGESSIVIAVASAHRGAAFDACRWLIDTLKKTVPIWKKEYFENGAVWADGEPFPEEIRPGR
jgi:MoaE-MoaD fusion protein